MRVGLANICFSGDVWYGVSIFTGERSLRKAYENYFNNLYNRL